jgi:protein SCO1
MRSAVLVCVLVAVSCALFACGDKEAAAPLSAPGEKLYTVRGVILSRNEGMNSVNMDHEEIPGFMTAMRMDYTVRGVKVASLPPDRSRVEAKLHVTERSYWITDVKRIP